MNCPVEYWIWLQRAFGAGKRAERILEHFGDPETLYEAGRKEWRLSGILSEKEMESLTRYSPSQSYDILQNCRKNGWHIVPFDDEAYPPLLREIYGYPLVLYVWGDLSVLQAKVCIGMVGTRDASDYGVQVAEALSYSLAQAGVVIVSGGALGIDKASHRGAVMAGGRTVAILGCGLGHPYLAENEKMRRVIAQNGAVISEYEPYAPPTRHTFPIRNRLISGMSLGTVVIEAGERSGSLITAKLALEQGRDVFAVPGDITSSNFFGTNSLIRDGARPVFTAMDVLDGYLPEYGEYLKAEDSYQPLRTVKTQASGQTEKRKTAIRTSRKTKSETKKENEKRKTAVKIAEPTGQEEKKNEVKPKPQLPSYATENAKKLFAVMTDEPRLTDELVTASGLPVQDVLSSLTELELYALVTLHSGKRYSLNTEQ